MEKMPLATIQRVTFHAFPGPAFLPVAGSTDVMAFRIGQKDICTSIQFVELGLASCDLSGPAVRGRLRRQLQSESLCLLDSACSWLLSQEGRHVVFPEFWLPLKQTMVSETVVARALLLSWARIIAVDTLQRSRRLAAKSFSQVRVAD